MMHTWKAMGAVAAALLVAGANAGELGPPPGPVAPTMKDLDTVEPRIPIRNDFDTLTPIVIDSPGSYYLAEEILGLPNQHGIEISASDVTLDLRGFRILGNTEVGSNDGIHIGAGVRNVSIFGGSVVGFFGDGVEGLGATNLRVSDVYVAFSVGDAVRCGGGSAITRCIAESNGGAGFRTADGCVIVGSTAASCDDGFALGDGCSARDCAAEGNSDTGFRLADGAVATNCTSSGNGEYGFFVDDASAIACSASFNGVDGFFLTRGVLRESTAQFNAQYGVSAFDSTVDSCHALRNEDSGVYVNDDCVITGCTARENGPFELFIPGIEVVGEGNRIQGNTMLQNDVGLVVAGTGNFIVQNTFHSNGINYSIVAGNAVGPVLNVAGVDITSTNPWRNFEY